MLSSHLSKKEAQQGVNSTKANFKDLTISEVAKTMETATITVSNTTIVAVRNSAVDRAASTATGTMKPAPGATVTTEFESIFGKGTSRTELTKAANEKLLKGIIYTYWDDPGQFGNKNPRKTGPYSNSVYMGAKEYLSYDSAHADDRKKRHILLDGVNNFGSIFRKYEQISIQDSHLVGDYCFHS